ncbi:hypothetical protein WS54_00885 [Burkholderia sp. NRF60-BP8]|nr:hypothetical protein WS54_00885 [Burkholderia sp. NRF60-BP8]
MAMPPPVGPFEPLAVAIAPPPIAMEPVLEAVASVFAFPALTLMRASLSGLLVMAELLLIPPVVLASTHAPVASTQPERSSSVEHASAAYAPPTTAPPSASATTA